MGLEDYVRLNEYKEEVALVHLVNPALGKRIDLVGAAHIGTHEYYDSVKRLLADHDVVLYEMIKKSSEPPSLRDKFILFNGLPLRECYQQIAAAVTKQHAQHLTNSVKDLTKRHENIKEMELICQADAIDYEKLPMNWHHADLTVKEVNSRIGIFSRANLGFCFYRIAFSLVMKYDFVMNEIVKFIIEKGLLSEAVKNSINKNNFSSSLDRAREEKVYEQIERLEQKDEIEKIGVFYGVGHFPFLEKNLSHKGYAREGIEYLEAIRRMPNEWEKVLRKYYLLAKDLKIK